MWGHVWGQTSRLDGPRWNAFLPRSGSVACPEIKTELAGRPLARYQRTPLLDRHFFNVWGPRVHFVTTYLVLGTPRPFLHAPCQALGTQGGRCVQFSFPKWSQIGREAAHRAVKNSRVDLDGL